MKRCYQRAVNASCDCFIGIKHTATFLNGRSSLPCGSSSVVAIKVALERVGSKAVVSRTRLHRQNSGLGPKKRKHASGQQFQFKSHWNPSVLVQSYAKIEAVGVRAMSSATSTYLERAPLPPSSTRRTCIRYLDGIVGRMYHTSAIAPYLHTNASTRHPNQDPSAASPSSPPNTRGTPRVNMKESESEKQDRDRKRLSTQGKICKKRRRTKKQRTRIPIKRARKDPSVSRRRTIKREWRKRQVKKEKRRITVLRRRLRALRRTNRASKRALRERHRLRQFLHQSRENPSSEAEKSLEALLPVNEALESAAAWTLSEHRDPRTELEFTRHLLHAMLLSLASPIQEQWDPYDVKPQVFALDQYIALPVFTNIKYLRLFCHRFNITVRDPNGVLWAAPNMVKEAPPSTTTAVAKQDEDDPASFRYRSPPPYGGKPVFMKQAPAATTTTDSTTSSSTASPPNSSAADPISSVSAAAVHPTSHQQKTPLTESGGPIASPPVCPPQPSTTIAAETGITPDDLFADMESEVALVKAPSGQSSSSVTRRRRRRRRRKIGNGKRPKGSAQPMRRMRGWGRRSLKEGSSHRGRASPSYRRRRRGDRVARRKTHRRPAEGPAGEAPNHNAKKSRSSSEDPTHEDTQERQRKEDAAAAYTAHLQTIRPFQIQQARPLPTFGLPFLRPYCIGYFADVHTLLHNASILSEKVDIILNPGSPIEMVLARERTDEVLHGRGGGSYVGSSAVGLLRSAYQRVERVLRREFGQFFRRQCPEVQRSSSACVALPLNTLEQQDFMENDPSFLTLREDVSRVGKRGRGRQTSRHSRSRGGDDRDGMASPLQELMDRQWKHREALYSGGSQFEIVIMVDSLDEAKTFYEIQQAKQKGLLLGHYSLDIIPTRLAADHVRDAATVFYEGADQKGIETEDRRSTSSYDSSNSKTKDKKREENHQSATEWLTGFRQAGASVVINPFQSPESFFHDPGNAYTESHAIFTEELKYRGGGRR